MFKDCESLISLDLSNLNVSKVTNMSYMFANCYSLVTLPNISIPPNTNTENMFYYFKNNNNCKII